MKIKIVYLFVLVLLIVLLFGCIQTDLTDEIGNEELVNVTAIDGEIVERSEKISDLVVELYGIDDATTIIIDDTAIIGVKIAYNQKITEDLSALIKKTVLDEESDIKKVLVTDKDSIFSEINSIVTELLQGKTYDSMVNDIKKTMNKVK